MPDAPFLPPDQRGANTAPQGGCWIGDQYYSQGRSLPNGAPGYTIVWVMTSMGDLVNYNPSHHYDVAWRITSTGEVQRYRPHYPNENDPREGPYRFRTIGFVGTPIKIFYPMGTPPAQRVLGVRRPGQPGVLPDSGLVDFLQQQWDLQGDLAGDSGLGSFVVPTSSISEPFARRRPRG